MKQPEFAQFNECPHEYIELPNYMKTLSLKLPNGKRMTICSIPQANCVDIELHDGPTIEFNQQPMVVQPIVIFGGGTTLYDYRRETKHPLLMTFLTGD